MSRSAQEFVKAATVCYVTVMVALNVSLVLRPGELDLVANPPWTRVSAVMAVFTFFDGVCAASAGFVDHEFCPSRESQQQCCGKLHASTAVLTLGSLLQPHNTLLMHAMYRSHPGNLQARSSVLKSRLLNPAWLSERGCLLQLRLVAAIPTYSICAAAFLGIGVKHFLTSGRQTLAALDAAATFAMTLPLPLYMHAFTEVRLMATLYCFLCNGDGTAVGSHVLQLPSGT